MSQGPAGDGTVGRRLLPGEHRGPAHFQQLPTFPHLGPVQGLPPGPDRGHGFLGHWGDLTPDSWMLAPCAFTVANKLFLTNVTTCVSGVRCLRAGLMQARHYSFSGHHLTPLCKPATTRMPTAQGPDTAGTSLPLPRDLVRWRNSHLCFIHLDAEAWRRAEVTQNTERIRIQAGLQGCCSARPQGRI